MMMIKALMLAAFLGGAEPDYMARLTVTLPLDEACGPAGRLRFGRGGAAPASSPSLDFSQPTNSQYLGTLA